MIDSHCHLDRLDLATYNGSLSQALDAARKAGVKGFLCIGIGFDQAEQLIALESEYEDVWLSMGVHPLDDALSVMPRTEDIHQLQHWCAKKQVIAIGETGLDYHYQPQTRETQIASFCQHFQVAAELKKPIIIHTRGAEEDTLALMNEHRDNVKGILHCFTESWAMAEKAIDMGYFISISGIASFKNAQNVRDIAKQVPLERLLIETDSPYLAPVPFRGKPNEPAYLPYVAEVVAQEQNIDLTSLIEATTENFHRLFPSTLSSGCVI